MDLTNEDRATLVRLMDVEIEKLEVEQARLARDLEPQTAEWRAAGEAVEHAYGLRRALLPPRIAVQRETVRRMLDVLKDVVDRVPQDLRPKLEALELDVEGKELPW